MTIPIPAFPVGKPAKPQPPDPDLIRADEVAATEAYARLFAPRYRHLLRQAFALKGRDARDLLPQASWPASPSPLPAWRASAPSRPTRPTIFPTGWPRPTASPPGSSPATSACASASTARSRAGWRRSAPTRRCRSASDAIPCQRRRWGAALGEGGRAPASVAELIADRAAHLAWVEASPDVQDAVEHLDKDVPTDTTASSPPTTSNKGQGGNATPGASGALGISLGRTGMPTVSKIGGIAGGGKSGQVTSPASGALRDITGGARWDPLRPITGTSSIGGSIGRAIPFLGVLGTYLDYLNFLNSSEPPPPST